MRATKNKRYFANNLPYPHFFLLINGFQLGEGDTFSTELQPPPE